LIQKASPEELAFLFTENADESHAHLLGKALAGQLFTTTTALASAVRHALPRLSHDDQELSVRRVFQAIRIAVNDELSALDALLRQLPACLNPGGRAAFLTFHSGEDRRVKKAFAAGLREGVYAEISPELIRPSPSERHSNPRSAPAKLRWALKA
jgi:16S rRNA (cytosine1402-N4)-methyltransferase